MKLITRELIKLFFTLISYSLEDLTDDRAYLVSLNVSVCTESTCDATYVILNKMVLPKQPCSWSEGFAVPGQSLNLCYFIEWISVNEMLEQLSWINLIDLFIQEKVKGEMGTNFSSKYDILKFFFQAFPSPAGRQIMATRPL